MKNILAIIAVVSILAAGALAFAHGPGGHMTGQGGGGHMMGAGHGKGGGHGAAADKEFLDKTVDLRRDLHNKKFEYHEAARNPETTVETLTKFEKDISDLQAKIREIAPGSAYNENAPCWER